MNKSQWVAAVAEATGTSRKKTDKVLSLALEVIAKELAQGEEVQLSGFGTFEFRYHQSRVARNPRSGDTVVIPERMMLAFRPSPNLLEDQEK